MKKIIAILSVALLLGITASAQYENQKIKVGQQAPDLSYASPDGTTYSLAKESKGRYLLVDFWASWCGPCRRSNPGLVAFYAKYKDAKLKNAPKGFSVFSVSLDRNRDAWVKAIKDDNLSWPYHISDLKAWQSEAAAAYGITYIPQAFLIGPDGKIIGKYANAEQAAAELEKFVVTGKGSQK